MTSEKPEKTAPEGLPQFEVLGRPFLRLMILVLPVGPVVYALIYHTAFTGFLAEHTNANLTGTLALCTNLYIFFCFWLVYFSSGWKRPFRCQSLRSLLIAHANQWSEPEPGSDPDESPSQRLKKLHDKQVAGLREKARSTLTSQAIFIALTVFIMSALARNPDLLFARPGADLDYWVASGALVSALMAFTLLLVSTDAAETMFNSFKVREWQAVSTLYRHSARLKYHGFVLTFLSICLFTFTINPVVASTAIVLFLLVGYRYWFPDISPEDNYRYEGWVFGAYIALTNVIVFAHGF